MISDKIFGAALVALGTGGIFVAMQISVRTFNDDPGPKLFPIFACAILVLCGIGMLLTRSKETAPPFDPEQWKRGLTMGALFIAYALGLWLTGFYVATLVMVYAFYHVIAGPERRVFWRGAVYALAVTGGVHLVFAMALNAFLPRGILF